MTFLDVIPSEFELDPIGEEFETGGLCGGGDCDGILADPACAVTISGPRSGRNTFEARYIVIEPASLAAGASCQTLVFVATNQPSNKGGKKKSDEIFPPDTCQMASNFGGNSITNTITLNDGLKVFANGTTEFKFGPIDPIQLVPVGCP